MEHINLSKYQTPIQNTEITPKFKGEQDVLAWEIARYFDEPYMSWQGRIKRSTLYVGQVRHEFGVLKTKKFGKKDMARMLMKTMQKK